MYKSGVCKQCGAHVSSATRWRGGVCLACRRKREAAEKAKRLAAWDRHCEWCGAPIPFTYNTAVRTCSRKCQMYLIQSLRKETKEQLEARLLNYIKQQDHYVKVSELRKHFHISDKLLYARGVSCPELNFRAGHLDRLPENAKTKKEIEDAYATVLKEDPSLPMHEVGKRIHVSAKRMIKLKISAADIRKRYGILGTRQKTKAEVEALAIAWLKTQPCYRTTTDVCRAIGVDYECSFRNKGLNIVELNKQAGHPKPFGSYFEDHAFALLEQEGIRVTRQKTYPDCRDKLLLRFDFWLPDFDVLIEVQGTQHYTPKFPKYESIVRHDEIKRNYAAEHKIPLYYIDTTPRQTFVERMIDLIKRIEGAGRATSPVHTASNCGETLTSNVEGNPQPSYVQGTLF